MNYFLLIIFLSLLTLSQSISTSGKQTLLYYVTNEDSLNFIDKSNKVNLLDDSSIEIFNDKNDDSSMPKLYSLLYQHKDYMLIGTRNKMINISLENVNSNKILSWPQSNLANAKLKNKNECLSSKLSTYLCQNYIRTAVPLVSDDQNDSLIICGTNSSQPYCRKYTQTNETDFNLVEEFQNPQLFTLNKMSKSNKFDSQNNMIPAFSHKSESIYFVNSGSFTQEPSINKQILKNNKFSSKLVKTPRGALKNANFRSSFEHNDKIYFFYSETDLADETNGLTFKTPYSLIGEVCADDNGRASFSGDANRFLTFKKTIIYCYLPDYKDEFHLKYTEIQAVTKPINMPNTTDEDTFYAIFTFRRANSIDSALCKYKVSTVQNTMKGYFKSMEHHKDSITYRRPLESCNKYKELKESTLNEYNKEMNKYYKFEMEQTVNEPALFALSNVKFTSIVIDPASLNNNFNDVIFIGTDNGRVLKLITRDLIIESKQKKFKQPIIVQDMQIFDSKPVTSLIISNDKLIAMSDEEIKSFRLEFSCNSYLSCAECIVSQDPYCSWSFNKQKCTSSQDLNTINDHLNGDITKCYDSNTKSSNDSDLAILYSIKNQEQIVQTTGFDQSIYRKLDSMVNKNQSNNNGLIVAVFLTALITCLGSVLFTWLFIKKRYQMAEYVAKHLLQTSLSNRSSSSSYNTYSTKKYLSTDQERQEKKCKNFYEKPSQDLRYIEAPDSPITSTTLTNESNQHSPAGNQLLRSLNSALSSSDDSFEPQSLNNSDRRMIYSAIDSSRPNSDIHNITTNLLSRADCNNV